MTTPVHDRRRFVGGVGALFIAALMPSSGDAEAQTGGLSGVISRAREGLSGLFGGILDGLFRR